MDEIEDVAQKAQLKFKDLPDFNKGFIAGVGSTILVAVILKGLNRSRYPMAYPTPPTVYP